MNLKIRYSTIKFPSDNEILIYLNQMKNFHVAQGEIDCGEIPLRIKLPDDFRKSIFNTLFIADDHHPAEILESPVMGRYTCRLFDRESDFEYDHEELINLQEREKFTKVGFGDGYKYARQHLNNKCQHLCRSSLPSQCLKHAVYGISDMVRGLDMISISDFNLIISWNHGIYVRIVKYIIIHILIYI